MSNPFIIDDPAQLTDVLGGVVDLQPHRNNPSRSNRRRVAFFEDQQPLPAIRSASELLADQTIYAPEEVVAGFLHRGSKGALAAPSKVGKTWMLVDLAVSVASGLPWFGFATNQGRVLLVNFEIQEYHLRNRIQQVVTARQSELENPSAANLSNLDIWTLRGHASPFTTLMPVMSGRINEADYALIIIDPVYKGMAGMNENDAADMGELLNTFERLAVDSGAAVVYAHHFAKGKQAGKNGIDRMSGSGVFGRDADSIILLTPHETDDCYQVEMVLRNHPPQPLSVVQWDFPLMRPILGLDPKDLKGMPGRPKSANKNADAILAALEKGPLAYKECMIASGLTKGEFDNARNYLVELELIESHEKKWRIKPEATPTQAEEPDESDVPQPPAPTQPVKVLVSAG